MIPPAPAPIIVQGISFGRTSALPKYKKKV